MPSPQWSFSVFEIVVRLWKLSTIFFPVLALWVPLWVFGFSTEESIREAVVAAGGPEDLEGDGRIVPEGSSAGLRSLLRVPGRVCVGLVEAATAPIRWVAVGFSAVQLQEVKGGGAIGGGATSSAEVGRGMSGLESKLVAASGLTKISSSGEGASEQAAPVPPRKSSRAVYCTLLRHALESAGPVYIKWGQWASSRYDLFPAELCDELNQLTQNSPEHPFVLTKEIMERNFGAGIFRYLDLEEEPIASGSIGQVYRGLVRIGKWSNDKISSSSHTQNEHSHSAVSAAAPTSLTTSPPSSSLVSADVPSLVVPRRPLPRRPSSSPPSSSLEVGATSSHDGGAAPDHPSTGVPDPSTGVPPSTGNARTRSLFRRLKFYLFPIPPSETLPVAVKVQHPDLDSVMALDFLILAKITDLTDRITSALWPGSYKLYAVTK